MEQPPTKLSGTKEERYAELFVQFQHLIEGETNLIAMLGIFCSLLKMNFETFSWVGFYLLENNELIVGPFQGKPPCIRIAIGKGVCGTSALKRETLNVPNVDDFPGHIRCDSDARSEIVVPIFFQEKFFGVLDVDSNHLDNFDELDKRFLEMMCEFLAKEIFQ